MCIFNAKRRTVVFCVIRPAVGMPAENPVSASTPPTVLRAFWKMPWLYGALPDIGAK